MTKDDDDGWEVEVPERKTEKVYNGTNKFLLELVTSGGSAAIAIAPLRGNITSIARYAPSQALNFAFKEQYKNYFLKNVDKNERFMRFTLGNFQSGGAAGATVYCMFHALDNVFSRSATVGTVRKARTRANREGLGIKSLKSLGISRGQLFVSLPATVINRSLYFGLYDTLKVVVASDGQKPTIFVAAPLALGTTTCAELLSLIYYAAGKMIMMRSEYEEFPEKSKSRQLLYEDICVKHYKDFSGNREQVLNQLRRSIQIRNDTATKLMWSRIAASAMVLVLYEEIQKWMH